MGRPLKHHPDRPQECPLCGAKNIHFKGMDTYNGYKRWMCATCGISWSREALEKQPKSLIYFLAWQQEQTKDKPRSQRQLAIAIGISPSQMSRAIKKHKK